MQSGLSRLPSSQGAFPCKRRERLGVSSGGGAEDDNDDDDEEELDRFLAGGPMP